MAGPLKFGGIVLAAGASSRMGRDKALLPWPPGSSETLLSAAIGAFKPFTHAVVVVAGKNAAALEPIANACGASLVLNPAPERGQFSSLQCGLRAALDHGCAAAMITPVDCPPLGASSLEMLSDAFQQALGRGHWAVAPEHDGRHGHPLLASRELIEAYLAAPVTSNARAVNQTCADKLEFVAVPEPLLAIDVNTPEEYTALAAKAALYRRSPGRL